VRANLSDGETNRTKLFRKPTKTQKSGVLVNASPLVKSHHFLFFLNRSLDNSVKVAIELVAIPTKAGVEATPRYFALIPSSSPFFVNSAVRRFLSES
jgi:hypothetical protein